MNSPASIIRRLVTTVAVGAVFIGLASIFVPDWTQADFERSDQAESLDSAWESTDPHAGLRSLGIIENDTYRVEIWAGDQGPRFTVYRAGGSKPIATLLSAEQVAERFPSLPLPQIDFDMPGMLMMADPEDEHTNNW